MVESSECLYISVRSYVAVKRMSFDTCDKCGTPLYWCHGYGYTLNATQRKERGEIGKVAK
jgi:hypothetical protein